MKGGRDEWGMVQERQARLVDSNRDLLRKSEEVRRETVKDHRARENFLAQTFGTSKATFVPSKDQSNVGIHSHVTPRGSLAGGRTYTKTPAFQSRGTINPAYETTNSHFFGVENAHHLAGMRALAKTHFFDGQRTISKWGKLPGLD